MADAPSCAVCRGLGWLSQGTGSPVPCACKFEEMRGACLRTAQVYGELPEARPDWTLDSVDWRLMPGGLQESAYALARGQKQCWVVLYGGPGVGKTHLAVGIVRGRLARAIETWTAREGLALGLGKFTHVPRMLQDLRRRFDDPTGGTFDDRLAEVCAAPLLVLDDMGAERSTEWARETLLEIVDSRWLQRRDTVVTTNVPLASFEPRLRSRMLDTADQVEVFFLTAADWRTGARA